MSADKQEFKTSGLGSKIKEYIPGTEEFGAKHPTGVTGKDVPGTREFRQANPSPYAEAHDLVREKLPGTEQYEQTHDPTSGGTAPTGLTEHRAANADVPGAVGLQGTHENMNLNPHSQPGFGTTSHHVPDSYGASPGVSNSNASTGDMRPGAEEYQVTHAATDSGLHAGSDPRSVREKIMEKIPGTTEHDVKKRDETLGTC